MRMLKLDLQLFADGLIDFDENDDNETLDEFGDIVDGGDEGDEGDVELDESDYDDGEIVTEGTDPEDEEGENDEGEEGEEGEDEGEGEEAKPDNSQSKGEPSEKKEQSPEDNARFAEMRRQKQAEESLKNSPEYQLVQLLSEANGGASVQEMLAKAQELQIHNEAKKRNVSVEQVRQERAAAQENQSLRNELNQVKAQLWASRIRSERSEIKQEMPYLTDQEVDEAVKYMLETLKNPDLPLKQAVHSLYGTKITEKIRESIRQEVLAEMSGRTASPIPPKTGKSNRASGLTNEEKQMARNLGISEAEYLKYK